MAMRPRPSGSKGVVLNLFLLVLIALTSGGLYLAFSSIGLLPDPGPTLGKIPWIGPRIHPTAPAAGGADLRDLESRQASEARRAAERDYEEKWKTLHGAEEEMNAERQRLTQWEEALEKREEAIRERETEARNKDAAMARLVTYYSSMRPVDAARILAQQEDLVVVEVFKRMDERQVSAIVAAMDPQIAGPILRKMATP